MSYSIVSRCLGVLLLAAAGLKGYGFGVDPVARTGVFSAPAFQFVVIAFEGLLGVWLLSGKQSAGAWAAVLSTFTGFAGISFYQGWIGHASCGCLGSKVIVNPWLIFGIDIGAIAALLAARPDLHPLWENRGRIARAGIWAFGGYGLLLGLLAASAHYRYGSIEVALAILRSERLSVNPSLIDMGEGAPGGSREATVALANRADRPIQVFGGTADCSCTAIGDLPVTIPPGEARSITIIVRLPNSPGRYDRNAELNTDDQGFSRVGVRLTGRIK